MTNFKQDIQNHNVERALRLLSTEVKDGGDLQKSVGFLSTLFNDGLLKGFIDDIGHKNFFDKLDVVVNELCKARKDLSKLKKVQKMVTRGGRTFIQTYYEEVEPKKSRGKIGLYDLSDEHYRFIVNTQEYKQAYSDYIGNDPKPTLRNREKAHSFALNFAYEKRKHEFIEPNQKKIFEEFLDEDTGGVVNIERNIEIHPISVKVEIENKISELQDKLAPIRDERSKVYDETLELKFEIEDKKSEVRELQKQLRQAHFDQEQDIVNAQEVSPEEADRVAQEYGELMNDLETQISTLAQEIPPLVKRYNERDEALMDIEDDMEPIEDEIENLKTKLDTMTFEASDEDFNKSIDEVTDTLNKSFLDGLVDEQAVEIDFKNLDAILEKARPHKYYKREGSPGNYKYYYTKEGYEKKKKKVEGGKEGLKFNESQRKTVENKPVGSTHEHNGKKYKKQANGKWLEVSEQGMTRKEHYDKVQYSSERLDAMRVGYNSKEGKFHQKNLKDNYKQYKKLSGKEHSDEEVMGGEKK